MRVQELYNQYCRKEITTEDFLFHVRRDPLLKEYISPVNSAEDVILILKQRAGIREQVTNEDLIIQEKEVEGETGESLPDNPEFGEELEEDYDDEEKYNEIDKKYGTDEVRDVLEKNDLLGFDFIGAAENAILTHKDWSERWDVSDVADINVINTWRKAVIDKAKVNKGKLQEATKKKKLTADDVIYSEFSKGWKHEYLNNSKIRDAQDIDKAKEIALKNLSKDPIYYTNLIIKQTEERFKTAPKETKEKILKAPTDQVELKDKANQMKNVKKDNTNKSNVKTNLGKKEKAKGNPKGVKVMKLKESIRQELKSILKENPLTKDQIQKLSEKTTIGDFQTWKKSVIPVLAQALKTDDEKAEKIFKHYEKSFDANHKSGMDAKSAVKTFTKGMKKIKEDAGARDKFEKDQLGTAAKSLMSPGGKKDALHRIEKMMGKAKDEKQKTWLQKVKSHIDSIQENEEYKGKLNDPEYKYYVCQIFDDGTLNIVEGFEYENDAKDNKKEHLENHADANIKVLSKRYLVGKKINPDDNKIWSDAFDKGPGRAKLTKEEFQDNTAPEKTDWQDVKLGSIEENSNQLVKDTIKKMEDIIKKSKEYINASRKRRV